MVAIINPLQTLLVVGAAVETVTVSTIAVTVRSWWTRWTDQQCRSKYTEEHQGEVPKLQEGWS